MRVSRLFADVLGLTKLEFRRAYLGQRLEGLSAGFRHAALVKGPVKAPTLVGRKGQKEVCLLRVLMNVLRSDFAQAAGDAVNDRNGFRLVVLLHQHVLSVLIHFARESVFVRDNGQKVRNNVLDHDIFVARTALMMMNDHERSWFFGR